MLYSVPAGPPNALRSAAHPPAAARRATKLGRGWGKEPSASLGGVEGVPPQRILHSAAHPKLDPLLSNLINLVCRWFILTWYSNITRDPDRAFVGQVTSILVHVIQALEVRIAHVDFVELVALDLPALLEQHVKDWEEAEDKARTSHAHNLDRDEVFHRLQSHIAISLVASPSGVLQPSIDKTYLRSLVDNLLRLLLPPEDYRADTERTIIREIVVNIVLGNVFTKVAQPWFLHLMIARVLEGRQAAQSDPPKESSPTLNPTGRSALPHSGSPTLAGTIGVVLRGGVATLASVPTLLKALAVSISTLYHTAMASPVPAHFRDRPPLTTPALSLLATILPPSPLLVQTLHYVQLPLALGSSFVTSILFYVFNDKVFTPKLTEMVLQVATRALFPDGRPPPREPDPTSDEQVELKKRCEQRVAEALPGEIFSFSGCFPQTTALIAVHLSILQSSSQTSSSRLRSQTDHRPWPVTSSTHYHLTSRMSTYLYSSWTSSLGKRSRSSSFRRNSSRHPLLLPSSVTYVLAATLLPLYTPINHTPVVVVLRKLPKRQAKASFQGPNAQPPSFRAAQNSLSASHLSRRPLSRTMQHPSQRSKSRKSKKARTEGPTPLGAFLPQPALVKDESELELEEAVFGRSRAGKNNWELAEEDLLHLDEDDLDQEEETGLERLRDENVSALLFFSLSRGGAAGEQKGRTGWR